MKKEGGISHPFFLPTGREKCEKEKIELYVPSPVLCTDNGAMIGCAGYYKYKEGQRSGLDMDAHANMPLSKAK